MRKLTLKAALIFALIGSVSGYAQDNVDGLGFERILANMDQYESMKDASDLAIRLLDLGSAKLNSAGKTLSSQVKQKLQVAQFKKPKIDSGYNMCGQLREAFVDFGYLDSIFMCPKLLEGIKKFSLSETIGRLAQLFIHEGVHLVQKAKNECVATELEIKIMSSTEGVKSWANVDKYDSECNFSWIKD